MLSLAISHGVSRYDPPITVGSGAGMAATPVVKAVRRVKKVTVNCMIVEEEVLECWSILTFFTSFILIDNAPDRLRCFLCVSWKTQFLFQMSRSAIVNPPETHLQRDFSEDETSENQGPDKELPIIHIMDLSTRAMWAKSDLCFSVSGHIRDNPRH